MLNDPEFERTLVTTENWKEYSDPLKDSYGFFEYLKANRHLVSLMGNILVKAQNFEELKNELSSLYSERKSFIEFAQNNYPEP